MILGCVFIYNVIFYTLINFQAPTFWRAQAKSTITQKVKNTFNQGVAKNVIIFLGDGMSIPTVTAARILKGQLQGHKGEETKLSFEQFPISGLSKVKLLSMRLYVYNVKPANE